MLFKKCKLLPSPRRGRGTLMLPSVYFPRRILQLLYYCFFVDCVLFNKLRCLQLNITPGIYLLVFGIEIVKTSFVILELEAKSAYFYRYNCKFKCNKCILYFPSRIPNNVFCLVYFKVERCTLFNTFPRFTTPFQCLKKVG